MKKSTFTLLIILMISMIIALVFYNQYDIYQERQQLQELVNTNTKQPQKEVKNSKTTIQCIGDSLTLGDSKTSYPDVLSNLTHLPISKFGGKNDQSIDIAIRMGRTQIMTNDVTIPATPTPVEINIYDTNNNSLDVLKTSGNNFSSVEIDGITGKLKYDSEKKVHIFTRDQKGEEKVISKPTRIMAKFPTFNKDDIAIIFTGTYDPYNTNSIFKTITYQRSMINQLKTKKYIVVSLTSKRRFPIVDDMNKVLQQEHGEHFLDFRNYLLKSGLDDAHITPTRQDEKDLANRYIPSSLLKSDKLNGNAQFNQLLAQQIIQKMIDLNYIEESQLAQ